MNCPYCDNELVDEEATSCPKCGKSLTSEDDLQSESIPMQQKQTDLVLAAALLTIVAAALSAGLGYLGVYRYLSYVAYYDFSLLLGFLIMAVVGLTVSVFAIAGGLFMLKRKYIKFSMLGSALLLISVVINYAVLQYYEYGFADITVICEIAILIFSVLSGVLVATSKAEFD